MTVTINGGVTQVPRGSTVSFTVCLADWWTGNTFVTYRSSDEFVALSDSISPPNDFIAPGTCVIESATGREGPLFGVGVFRLIANVAGIDSENVETVEFIAQD